jgi:hypothetical protein
VGDRWVRDADGWYRIPGSWSRRRGDAATSTASITAAGRPAWRTTGPPGDHPGDAPGPAPGPDYFFVPGHYAPVGDRLDWIPGFWARQQVGWDWVPARWVRRPDGWEFRPGYWARDPSIASTRAEVRRRMAARPFLSSRPPAVVESEPAPGGPEPSTDRLPPPPDAGVARDPIAGAEEADRALDPAVIVPGPPPTVLVVPRRGMTYHVIRPPGYGPYGPGGVIVPDTVPPFVRRLLDRVLP